MKFLLKNSLNLIFNSKNLTSTLSKYSRLSKHILKTYNFHFTQINAFSTKTFKSNMADGYKINARFDQNLLNIELSLNDTQISSKNLPYIWLRDNCKCSECFNYATNEVDLDLKNITLDSKPKELREAEFNKIHIIWTDNHTSKFDLNELAKYALKHEIMHHKNEFKKIFWNQRILADENGGIKKFDFNDYANNKDIFKKVIHSIYKYGAVIIENVLNKPEEIVNVCKPIGPIQPTVFGDTFCVVNNKAESKEFVDRAYTDLSLRAHTDNVYLKNNSGLELFHVIQKPEKGGHSLLVDGFYCATRLKEQYPDDFNFLKEKMVEFDFSQKNDYSFRHMDKHITINPLTNELIQIKYNPYHKVNVNGSYEEIEKYYKAVKNFLNIVRDPSNEHWLSLNQDQVLIFDNFRLLHGRSAINGVRTLVTAYVSRDDYLSKLRINDINEYSY